MKSGFLGYLTLLLIYLKLTNQVEWGWWAVWSPLLLFFVIVYILGWSKQKLEKHKQEQDL